MARFVVNLAELDDSIAVMGRTNESIDTQLAALDARIAQLRAVWTGSASAAQAAAHNDWMTGAAAMRAGLAGMQAAARTAHGNYSAAVDANTRMWS